MTNVAMLKTINEFLKSENVMDLLTAKAQLEEDIRAEIQKSKGNASKDKIIKIMFNKTKNIRTEFKNAYVEFENQFVFLDGFRAYVLNDDYGYKKSDSNLDIKQFKQHGDVEIEVDINDVKFYIAKCKAENKDITKNPYIINTKYFEIGFNAQYLLEFVQMFGVKLFAKNALSAVYAECDNEEWGILLPIRIFKNM